MKAVVVREPGGPEVLEVREVERPQAGPGEVLIKVEVAGVNYADAGMRRGTFHGGEGPAGGGPVVPGFEVVGTVAKTGEGADAPAVGTRVAAVLEGGGYAEYAVAPIRAIVSVAKDVESVEAAGALLVQGITAHGVLHDAAGVASGETVLVQAAGGGVGTLAVQLAKLAGAEVIATAGSREKRELALSLGADHAVDYTKGDWTERVLSVTGDRGVDVVLESVGGEVGTAAYVTLAPLGRFVLFGAASGGPPGPPDLWQLNLKGQTVVGYGGPWLRPGAAARARERISAYLADGSLRVAKGPSFPLEKAADAHRAVEGRRSVGKVTLTVA